jgi:cardiolipin synthase A/B
LPTITQTTRDFAVVDTDRADVGAIDRVFIADWEGVPVVPITGADLVWSPGAEAALVSIIDGAHPSLLVENEHMADPYITAPLENAARRGVRVEVVMTASSAWDSPFRALSKAGVALCTYAPSSSLYIQAKAIVADEGHADKQAFVGSQNFSITSFGTTASSASPRAHRQSYGVASPISADYARGLPWQIAQ